MRIRTIILASAGAFALAGCAYDDYGYGYGDRYYGDHYYRDYGGYYRDYGYYRDHPYYRDDNGYWDRDDYGQMYPR